MKNIPTPEEIFLLEVFAMVDAGAKAIDAVVEWCDRHSVEVEYAAPLVKKSRKLRNLLKEEGAALHLLKREDT